MKKNYEVKRSNLLLLQKISWLFSILAILSSTKVFAEGSINLYPNGSANGARAFLVSGIGNYGGNEASWPFANLGDHYVYVKSGETIRVASSAQGVNSGQIILTAPNGTIYSSTIGSDTGRIFNRTQEVNGPGAATAGSGQSQFTTFNRTAAANQQGIWKVQFIAPGGMNAGDPSSVTMNITPANGNWTQIGNTSGGTLSSQITAWDISVVNGTTVQPGRTYFNQLNLLLSTDSTASTNSFYGQTYTVTNDGYLYRVKGNGFNGLGWIFFVNNKGLVNSGNNATYRSLNSSTYATVINSVTDPRTADDAKGITHKMFYVRPDMTMPATSAGAVPGTTANTANVGGTTWLNPPQVSPQISNLTIEGVEGTVNQMAVNKGIYIKFNTNHTGSYDIKISTTSPATFQTVTLTGTISSAGAQTLYWDGKDANGVIPTSGGQISVQATLNAGEVHFPYVDVELNPNGIIIERLNGTVSADQVEPNGDIIYWNDVDIPSSSSGAATPSNPKTNLTGISSNSNGHIWGAYGNTGGSGNSGTGGYDFGNEKTLDTWSYIRASISGIFPVVVARTDLEVVNITASSTTPTPGSTETYTIVVRNNGPYAMTATKPGTFSFILPSGITGSNSNITFNGNSCGSEVTAQTVTYDSGTNRYNSKLVLPVGCSITYTIGTTINSSAIIGGYTTTATIMRPTDVFDVDGTNPSIYNTFMMPTDPFQECSQWTTTHSCSPADTNNIKTNTVNVILAVCFEDPAIGAAPDTKMGITLLKRASSTPTQWPLSRKSGHVALESNTQGFVINKMSPAQMAALKTSGTAAEGMMVYDTTNNCLSVYSDGDWKCFNKATCP